MPDCLFEKRPDGVGLITMNRPESLNAMGGELMPLLAHYLEECERDRAVRCVALTGAGRAFNAGGDVKNMQNRNEAAAASSSPAAQLERGVEGLRASQAATSLRLHRMGKPTVALINGFAVGAGFSLALACDIRIMSDKAKVGTAFKNIALSGDYGGTYYLQRLVGNGKARELYFTAEMLDAQRALELGIVNRVVPHDELMAEGLTFCAQLAAGPTATYAKMKANLNLAETARLEDVLHQEALFQRLSGMSTDSREAVRAFVEKREPKFIGE
jgi:2-(1,2-epoxy-1,2-dihydrophenyl)acetyl-CoA isomerase